MGFVVVATWKAKPGQAEHVRRVLGELTAQNRAEPKMIAFYAIQSEDDPQDFVLIEHYVDATGYDDHRATEAFKNHVLGDLVPRLALRRVRSFTMIGPG